MATAVVTHEVAEKPLWRPLHTWALVAIVAAIATVGISLPANVQQLAFLGESTLFAWVLIAILMALFTIVAGHGVTGIGRGVLIDDRHRLSLSRLQMMLWGILVLSGYMAAALSNIGRGMGGPLEVEIPSELLLAMGISTASLVASPVALAYKQRRRPGQVASLPNPACSHMSDLFRGEETSDEKDLDLGKVQMFLFTVVLIVGYALALGDQFAGQEGMISSLPNIDGAVVSLLAISHAGYLTKKAIPTGPPPAGE
jgi:hypothetical protein